MRSVFEESTRFQRMLDVEAALAWARAEVGDIPKEAAAEILQHSSLQHVKLERIHEIEKTTDHEVMALVDALAEVSGRGGTYVHLGATSADILDTSLALQMKEGFALISQKMDRLEKVVLDLTTRYRDTMIIGRTHAQHALPMTLGLKFAVWLREIGRHIERLHECKQRVLVGKMSGAIGTMAGFGKNAVQIQTLVMQRLGLNAPEVTSQIIQRDRYAEIVCLFAMIASSLDKFATEIRNLQRPEIDELSEPFQTGKQVGSSAMPQKRNPWRSESISSIAKIERSLVAPALEGIVTWHERDLSQSASERFVIPESFILADHMLNSITRILSDLRVNDKKMLDNLMKWKDPMMAESVMIALVNKGMPRQEAHRLLQQIVFSSQQTGESFGTLLTKNVAVSRLLNPTEIESCLDPKSYLGLSGDLVDLAVRKTTIERQARGL
jgi:adenylosuccinate lyase